MMNANVSLGLCVETASSEPQSDALQWRVPEKNLADGDPVMRAGQQASPICQGLVRRQATAILIDEHDVEMTESVGAHPCRDFNRSERLLIQLHRWRFQSVFISLK